MVRPVNYVKIITTTVAILGTITACTVAAPYVLPIIQSRNLWAAISLIAVLLFTSGHMFNHIRKVPYVAGDGKGGISYFAGGFQNQFGLETQIVAAMCEFLILSHSTPTVTDLLRRHPCFRNHLSCSQGPSYDRPSHSGYCYTRMGSCHARHVQLPAQHFPHQERWLPLLPASFLNGMRKHFAMSSSAFCCWKLHHVRSYFPTWHKSFEKVPLYIPPIERKSSLPQPFFFF